MKVLKNWSGVSVNLHVWNENSGDMKAIVDYQKPRTRQSVTVWHLPDSVLVHILQGFHIKDIFNFQCAHPNFREIVENNKSVLTYASFFNSWPSESNLNHFVRASNAGNFEATVKLAVAYLYKEGLNNDAGKAAAEYLSRAEKLTPSTFPFYWIFIRPPWSPDGSCCKVQAFHHIKALVDEKGDKDLAFGVALTLKLLRLSLQVESKEEEKKYFKTAVTNRSAAAAFFSLLDSFTSEPDKAKELERIRLLRFIASKDILEAKLNLIKHYTAGNYGGISKQCSMQYVKEFFKFSKPSGIHATYINGKPADISRYILVDWLVEVVGMKDFSAHTLYLAVSMFDRYLEKRKVEKSKVQLLGVAAMVLSSRFLGFDILTIREAAWLTDNSYSYHDVVKMMGELVAALKGNIRVVTIQDYVKVLVSILRESGSAAALVEYIAMLCLLQAEMGQYSVAEVASACMLLSRILLNKADPWPTELQEWTGYTQDYLSLCTFHIHKKCLQEGAEVDYRDTKLQAVKIRYADVNRFAVSDIEIIGHKELCRRLGVSRLVSHGRNTRAIKFRNTDELIVSPRRGKAPELSFKSSLYQDRNLADRTHAATPPIKQAPNFEEGFSGYEGDMEDDFDETFSDLLNESDFDRSNPMDTDDSKFWDVDNSLQDCDSDENKVSCSDLSDKKESHEREIACISSMCHSRNKLSCRSTLPTSPSSCICNCSCKPSYCATSNLQPSSSHYEASQHDPFSTFTVQSFKNEPLYVPCNKFHSFSKSLQRDGLLSAKAVCDKSLKNKSFEYKNDCGKKATGSRSASPKVKGKHVRKCRSPQHVKISTDAQRPGVRDFQQPACFVNLLSAPVSSAQSSSSFLGAHCSVATDGRSVESDLTESFASPPSGQTRINICQSFSGSCDSEFISATPETSGCHSFDKFSPKSFRVTESLKTEDKPSPRRASKRVKLDYSSSISNTEFCASTTSKSCDMDKIYKSASKVDTGCALNINKKRKSSISGSNI